MHVEVCDNHVTSRSQPSEQRLATPELLFLLELDPKTVADGKSTGEGIVVEDVTASGAMRETCPYCEAGHLRLVLRQKHIKRAHLYCEECTRCFDARYADGTPALSLLD